MSTDYLGNKNQCNNCSGPSEVAETSNSNETVHFILHGIVDNDDNYNHKAGEIGSQDNFPIVIQPWYFHFPGF